MREARLVGLSQDGGQLILAVTGTGEEIAVPVDDRLRAALRGDRARLGQLEIQMESALRPRDIQARIRAGESVEAVAAVAQMPMERLMAFAGPVLAERDHIATLAQRASVRRRGGGDAPTRNLGTWVTERLRSRQIDPNSAEWDAWRRDDGRWAVRVSYPVLDELADPGDGDKAEKVAMFAYDAPGRYAVPDDDEARWLVGEQAQVLPPPVQNPPQPGERRLSAVADIDPGLAPDHLADSYEAGFEDTVSLPRSRQQPRFPRDPGEDPAFGGRDSAPGREPARETARNPGPVRDANPGRETGPVRESGRDAARGPRRVHPVPNPDEEPTLIDVPVEPPPTLRPTVRAVERPAEPPVEAVPTTPPEEQAAAPPVEPAVSAPAEAARETTPQASAAPEPSGEAEAEQPEPKKKPRRNSKRASVPSWDEIMFGKKAD